MRPKLKDYVFYTALTDGVLFRGLNGDVILRGKELYPWVERLAPYMDGTHTLEWLSRSQNEQRKKLVTSLIERLTAAGLVRDAGQDDETLLSAHETRRYAASLAHLENHCSDPCRVFAALRQRTIFVAGQGAALRATVQALLDMGVCKIATWTLCGETQQQLEILLSRYQQQDTAIMWFPLEETREPLLPADCDAVIYVDGSYASCMALRLQQQCYLQDKIFLSGGGLQDRLYIGPLTQPGKIACLGCARVRLSAGAFDEVETAPSLGPTHAALLGYALAYWLFCDLTGLPTPDQGKGLLSFAVDTITMQTHHLVAWPGCKWCQYHDEQELEMLDLVATYSEREHALAQEVFQQQVGTLTDQHVGILGVVTDEAVEQLPVYQVSVTVRGNGKRDVCLVVPAPDLNQARYLAQRAGLAAYAQWYAPAAEKQWWMDDAQVSSEQPGNVVFSTGRSYWEWIGTGLLEIMRRQVWSVAEQVTLVRPFHPADEDAQELVPYVKMLRIRFGVPVTLCQLEPPVPFPGQAVALFIHSKLADISVDLTAVRAAQRALIRLLQHVQHGESEAGSNLCDQLTALKQGLYHDLFAPDTAWKTWTQTALQHYRQHNTVVLLQPNMIDPALDAIGLLTGYIGITAKASYTPEKMYST